MGDVHAKRMREWLLWKVLLPFGFIALLWPLYRLVLHKTDAFEHAFARGEFLIFTAIVFLEVALELKYSRHPSDAREFYGDCARLSAIVLIFIYGFLHAAAVRAEGHSGTTSDLLRYSYFNCSMAVVAVSVSFLTYWKSKASAIAHKLDQVASSGGQ